MDLATIKGWVAGIHSPYGRVYQLPREPIPELAYLIGVNFGDTSRCKNWHCNYAIRLRAKDEDFAREFARAASVVLGKPCKVWFDKKRGLWQSDVLSMLLYTLLTKPLAELIPYTEHCDKCSAAFLRGFFDAEGSSSGGSASCSNTELNVLTYVKSLLETKFRFSIYGPYRNGRRPGSRVQIKGKWYHVRKQCYVISIAKGNTRDFAAQIGFSIARKQRGLAFA